MDNALFKEFYVKHISAIVEKSTDKELPQQLIQAYAEKQLKKQFGELSELLNELS